MVDSADVMGSIPWGGIDRDGPGHSFARTMIKTASGVELVFEVVPWCVRHDDEAHGSDECRIGWEETEPCDVRYDGSGHVWRFIPSSLNEYGSGHGS